VNAVNVLMDYSINDTTMNSYYVINKPLRCNLT